MAFPTPPAHLPGLRQRQLRWLGPTKRWHNRRLALAITPSGYYRLYLAKVLEPGEAAKLREQGHRDALHDYIVRDRVRYLFVAFSPEVYQEAFGRRAEPGEAGGVAGG